MNLKIHIDGGARGNPGPAAAAVVIHDLDSRDLLHEAGYFIGRATNNVAEYRGLLRALELAVMMRAEEVRVFSDSELMVKQVTGEYRVKSSDLQPLFDEAQALLLKIDTWQVKHVYREENKRADELANLAIDAKADVVLKAFDEAAAPGPAPSPLKAVPRWTATLTEDPGRACPAGCGPKKDYAFGPATPEGFCVYAALAVLEDGPLQSPVGKALLDTVRCRRCGTGIRVTSG